MTILKSIISGAVQGLTEFLPVSSSGHLVLLHFFFGIKEPQVLFDLVLHLGTLSAVIIYFARDILEIAAKQRRELWLIMLGATPLFFLGFLLKSSASAARLLKHMFVSPLLVGVMLFITGLWLFLPKMVNKISSNTKPELKTEAVRAWQIIAVGLAQAVAVLPGISRSGATISTGLVLGLSPRQAARFSFLLSIPAILGGLVFEFKDMPGQIRYDCLWPVIPGFLTAVIVGYIAINILLKVVYADKFYYFGFYCVLTGWAAILGIILA